MKPMGLQAKMTASYVLVTAAAVVLVEAVLVSILARQLSSSAGQTTPIYLTAIDYAKSATKRAARLGRLPSSSELQLGEPGLRLGPGHAEATADGTARIPYTTTRQDDVAPLSLALLLAPDGRVLVSSYPARYPVGDRLSSPQMGPLPAEVRTTPPTVWANEWDVGPTQNGDVSWASAPVLDAGASDDTQMRRPTTVSPAGAAVVPGLVAQPVGTRPGDLLGVVYVQVPAGAKLPMVNLAGELGAWQFLGPQLRVGLLVLVGAVPVGVVFGLLSTWRLIGRLRRLAATTVAVAEGDFRHRVPASGSDEVAQLERNFNQMAERLTAAMATERQLSTATERARIARELHDSISQDLFSLRVLAAGLRKALPVTSALRPQVETMEQTADSATQEMQALLLELRPVALERTGLIPALEEVSRAYHERLGVIVDAELEPIELAPPAEHAVLRVVQEALANAVKHGQPTRIGLRIHKHDSQVAVVVSDDGGGFDTTRAEHHLGLGLSSMRERVTELGGVFQLESTPGHGTDIRILLPSGRP